MRRNDFRELQDFRELHEEDLSYKLKYNPPLSVKQRASQVINIEMGARRATKSE